jgi:sulfide:quinone oxidoreductase
MDAVGRAGAGLLTRGDVLDKGSTILVLGAGVGGIAAAIRLRESLTREHRITIVDREMDYLFAPSLLWLMTGRRRVEQISRPLERLRSKGIEVLNGEIQTIDSARRQVTVDGRTHWADYLILSLGAELAPQKIPGLAEGGHNCYTLAGAQSLRSALEDFDGGRIAVLTAAPAYKCPAAPYEAAMLLEDNCRRQGIRERVSIDLYAAEPGPMGVAGPAVSAAVRQLVQSKGIGYHPEHQVVEVQDGRMVFAGGVTASFDLLAYVPPHQAPAVVRESGILDDSGWVAVDRRTLQTEHERVYAIGDLTGIPLKLGKPLPKAGVFAHREAEVVAANMASDIRGRRQKAAFDGHGECFVETGGGRAGFGHGDFYSEPTPKIRLHRPGFTWHLGKVLYERHWLRRWF